MKLEHNFTIILAMAVLCSACTGAKFLNEGQKYYDGADIKFEGVKPRGDVKFELDDMPTPDPNAKILGSRPKVWFYNIAKTDKEKGFKYWVMTRLGEPPIYFRDVDLTRNISLLENKLNNSGYFQARVMPEVKEGKIANKITYTAQISEPYRYDTIIFPNSSSVLQRSIRGVRDQSVLGEGHRYDLDKMKRERQRIEKALKDQGYYYFADQHLLFRADTTVGDRKIDLHLTVKPETPAEAKEIFTIGEVNIYSNYSFQDNERASSNSDTLAVEGMNYFGDDGAFRPDIIASHVRVRPGRIYTKEAELVTLNRLIQLDVFRFVNVDYKTMEGNELRADVFLTPFKKKSLRLELVAVTKSNNNVGPNFTASFRNRNFLKGAELFQLNLTAGYEVQVTGQTDQPLSSYVLAVENILTVPRFISPIKIGNPSSRFVPQTRFKLAFRSLRRRDFFNFNSAEADYGFAWHETITRRHELYPISIDYVQLSNVSAQFDSLLQRYPFLARSYEEQFIVGSNYSFFYNSQAMEGRTSRQHNFYFNGNFDVAGNLMHLLQSSMRSEENTDEEPYQLFGSPYSQYVKTDVDFRHYWRLNSSSTLASRMILGAGFAYGNSTVMPYIKQFSIGGPNSIRAFRARSVGPGAYEAPDTFIDQTADLKLEGNMEYRFDIVGAFKGAVFLDAGNVWSIREDEDRPGANFDSSEFLKQIAVGTGAGVRFDIQFFVIRLDLAFPLKTPADPRWRFSEISIGNKEWRQQNLILNIAIGYPF